MNTRIYKIEELQKIQTDKKYRDVFFKKGLHKAMLKIKPKYTELNSENSILGHLEFYALNDTWKDFTESGYKSIFFYHNEIKKYQKDDFVIEAFKNLLQKENFKFLESMQMKLF